MEIKRGGNLAICPVSSSDGTAPRSNERLFLRFIGNGHARACLGAEALGSQHVVSGENHG